MSTRTNTLHLKCRIDYFKKTGKWYTSEECTLDVPATYETKSYRTVVTPHFWKIPEIIKKARTLPGLSGACWPGPVLITFESYSPILFLEGLNVGVGLSEEDKWQE